MIVKEDLLPNEGKTGSIITAVLLLPHDTVQEADIIVIVLLLHPVIIVHLLSHHTTAGESDTEVRGRHITQDRELHQQMRVLQHQVTRMKDVK